MDSAPVFTDLACVIHAHSRHSDGTGTIPQIASAAGRAKLDAVLLTDHDTLAGLREEGWYGSVLVLVGEEVSPSARDHTLAFGVERRIDRRLSAAEICAAVGAQGGISFAAHPFSHGSPAFPRFGTGTPFTELDVDALTGLELWSFVTDTAESLTGVRDALRFIATPSRVFRDPPPRNLEAWDRLCERRRLVAIGGVDAHQIGIAVGGRVPLRLMSYARSFRHLRTHVLCDEPPSGELAHDRAQVYGALAAGRCYIAVDSLAPARGFAFWGDGVRMGDEMRARELTLRARLPRAADVRVLRGGAEVASAHANELDVRVSTPGPYRVEARLKDRTWILSNPIYLR